MRVCFDNGSPFFLRESMTDIGNIIPWYKQEGWKNATFPYILLELIFSSLL